MVVALKNIIENGKYEGPSELYKKRKDGIVRFYIISHSVELAGDKEGKLAEILGALVPAASAGPK